LEQEKSGSPALCRSSKQLVGTKVVNSDRDVEKKSLQGKIESAKQVLQKSVWAQLLFIAFGDCCNSYLIMTCIYVKIVRMRRLFICYRPVKIYQIGPAAF
jgi:hypothetical protein